MRFLADESVDRQIVEKLRDVGHEVLYIAELDPGISDKVVFDRANQIDGLLLTADKDFGEIVFKDKRLASGGVILLRLAGVSSQAKAEIVASELQKNEQKLSKCFTVIGPGKTRIRAEGFV